MLSNVLNVLRGEWNEANRELCVAASLGSCALSSVSKLGDTLQKGPCPGAAHLFSAKCKTVLFLVL